ncbi:Hypothetical protein SRAE_X000067600 [Strongyloides ratti]|uniref:Uncharacterized protein n=1 Tax=Strongyloides ratti TaxID=34506 RepID=A0A090LUP3_STRRB|nr:Hypothetical protein SRAE_X000067600 [Strongyloides ratti]CEF71349.1 Hypothetical protein SRAE_X000067600 [Strongyloides ratti]
MQNFHNDLKICSYFDGTVSSSKDTNKNLSKRKIENQRIKIILAKRRINFLNYHNKKFQLEDRKNKLKYRNSNNHSHKLSLTKCFQNYRRILTNDNKNNEYNCITNNAPILLKKNVTSFSYLCKNKLPKINDLFLLNEYESKNLAITSKDQVKNDINFAHDNSNEVDSFLKKFSKINNLNLKTSDYNILNIFPEIKKSIISAPKTPKKIIRRSKLFRFNRNKYLKKKFFIEDVDGDDERSSCESDNSIFF